MLLDGPEEVWQERLVVDEDDECGLRQKEGEGIIEGG